MSDAERKAMEWLDAFDGTMSAGHAATLRRLMAEPRLPRELGDAAKNDMRAAFEVAYLESDFILAIYRALYAHLTAPRTKEVEVWHVEYVGSHGEPGINVKSCRVLADDEADRLRVVGCSCIRVTGPHRQQVPA